MKLTKRHLCFSKPLEILTLMFHERQRQKKNLCIFSQKQYKRRKNITIRNTYSLDSNILHVRLWLECKYKCLFFFGQGEPFSTVYLYICKCLENGKSSYCHHFQDARSFPLYFTISHLKNSFFLHINSGHAKNSFLLKLRQTF